MATASAESGVSVISSASPSRCNDRTSKRSRGWARASSSRWVPTSTTRTVDRSDFGFDDNRGRFVVEPGAVDLYAGDSSTATLTRSFTVR